jgi:nucleoside-diphosphate-sugar epimerase
MKVLVTGATGYIGSAVCHFLKAGGHQAAGLARSAEKAAQLVQAGFEAVTGDLNDPGTLFEAARAADAVVHTAIQLDERAGARDREAVLAMLQALEGSRKPFVYTSGIWVMGDTKGRLLGELASVHPPPLVAWRPAVEQLVLEGTDRGVKPMVVRPGLVFGRGGGMLASFFHSARTEGVVRVVGTGENHWSLVHVEDLAELYMRMVEQPEGGELFLATGGTPQPAGKIARAVAKACGENVRVESISLEAARGQMGPLADCLAMDQKAGSTKAARFFGWTVRRPSVYGEILGGSYLA